MNITKEVSGMSNFLLFCIYFELRRTHGYISCTYYSHHKPHRMGPLRYICSFLTCTRDSILGTVHFCCKFHILFLFINKYHLCLQSIDEYIEGIAHRQKLYNNRYHDVLNWKILWEIFDSGWQLSRAWILFKLFILQ